MDSSYYSRLNGLFNSIHELAVDPNGLVSNSIKSDVLSRLTPLERKELGEKTKSGRTLFFTACKTGSVDVIKFLLAYCDINIERCCVFEEEGNPVVPYAPPLWCAAVCGHVKVVELLLKKGANVNACSNTGSTAVLSACFKNRLEVIRLLVFVGADIHRPNHDGVTCLMNAVTSVELCQYLIGQGANLNAKDVNGMNVLHHAIERTQLETVRLLIKNGVDPFVKCNQGNNALTLACLKGDTDIAMELLMNDIQYSSEDRVNAMELLGATLLYRHNDLRAVHQMWRRALVIRNTQRLIPKTNLVRRPCYGNAVEFTTEEELARLEDYELLGLQSVLITDRILGIGHKETQNRLIGVGAIYVAVMQYRKCINLWQFCLKTRIEQSSLFNTQTVLTAEELIRLLLELHLNDTPLEPAGFNHLGEPSKLCFNDIYQIFQLLTSTLEECRKLLRIRPVFKKQQQNFDAIFKCVTHLIYLMLRTANEDELITLKEAVTDLIKKNICSAGTNDTLLHLSVSRLNYIKRDIVIFPNYEVVALFLDCEARVNAQNESKSTPLHVATTPYNFNNRIIRLLLDSGSHVDLPNKLKDHPAHYIAMNPASDVPLANYSSLKCCAATVIVRHRIPYRGQLPQTLERFVKIHEA